MTSNPLQPILDREGVVILDGAIVGKNCVVGAQALIPLNAEIPEGSLVLGIPAKVVRKLSAKEIDGIAESAESYRKLGADYRALALT